MKSFVTTSAVDAEGGDAAEAGDAAMAPCAPAAPAIGADAELGGSAARRSRSRVLQRSGMSFEHDVLLALIMAVAMTATVLLYR